MQHSSRHFSILLKTVQRNLYRAISSSSHERRVKHKFMGMLFMLDWKHLFKSMKLEKYMMRRDFLLQHLNYSIRAICSSQGEYITRVSSQCIFPWYLRRYRRPIVIKVLSNMDLVSEVDKRKCFSVILLSKENLIASTSRMMAHSLSMITRVPNCRRCHSHTNSNFDSIVSFSHSHHDLHLIRSNHLLSMRSIVITEHL